MTSGVPSVWNMLSLGQGNLRSGTLVAFFFFLVVSFELESLILEIGLLLINAYFCNYFPQFAQLVVKIFFLM